MVSSRTIPSITGLVLLVGLLAPAPAADSDSAPLTATAGVTNSVGKATKMHSAVETAGFNCNSNTYQDISGMEVTFNTPKSGPIIVMFQAEWLNADNVVRVRALDNDVVFPGPGDTGEEVTVYDGSDQGTRGFNFIKQANAGSHTIKLQCRMPSNSENASLDNQTLIVFHR